MMMIYSSSCLSGGWLEFNPFYISLLVILVISEASECYLFAIL